MSFHFEFSALREEQFGTGSAVRQLDPQLEPDRISAPDSIRKSPWNAE